MKSIIKAFLSEAAALKQQVAEDEGIQGQLIEAATRLIQVVQAGGTVYVCGNGGSACDAMHFTEELVARYKRERNGIKAMHFMDGSTLTCWANDYDYESTFARYVDTFCGEKDALVAISTSGNSPNILQAVQSAKQKNCFSIGFAGKGGGKLAELADLCLVVPHSETDRIQEVHICFVHILVELIETELADLLNVKL